MKRTFVLAPLFESALKGRTSSDQILARIEGEILKNPKCGDIVQGTGGVRKFRSEDATRSKGKRGGFRVLYLDLPHAERTHLLFLYTTRAKRTTSARKGKRSSRPWLTRLREKSHEKQNVR